MMTKIDLGEKFKEALARVEQAEAMKKDVFKLPRDIRVNEMNRIEINGLGNIGFTKTGFQSFCTKLDLPSSYMLKLIDTEDKNPNDIARDKEVFATNIRRGIETLKEDKQILIRTYTHDNQSKVRAVFSDKYNVVDNYPLIKELARYDHNELEATNYSLTSDYLDVRFTMPNLKTSIGILPQHEQRFGITEDIVFPGIHFRNSEVGLSKISVSFIIYRLVCTNGLTRTRDQYKVVDQKHMGEFDIAQLNNRIAAISGNARRMFEDYVNHMTNARTIKVDSPEEVFESIGKRAGITGRMTKVINTNWITEQRSERTKHAVVNSITAGARDWDTTYHDFSGRMRMEEVAGELLFSKAL